MRPRTLFRKYNEFQHASCIAFSGIRMCVHKRPIDFQYPLKYLKFFKNLSMAAFFRYPTENFWSANDV